MLSYDSAIKGNYDLYQSILKAVNDNVYDQLKEILTKKKSKEVSSFMNTSLKTLRKHLPYIKNTFIYAYSNGPLEGINNKIKVIKRIAFGFRM